jgi:hypothetical protein
VGSLDDLALDMAGQLQQRHELVDASGQLQELRDLETGVGTLWLMWSTVTFRLPWLSLTQVLTQVLLVECR